MTIFAGFKAALAQHAPVTADTMPATGLVAGSMVMTRDGELPVQFLAPGDRILTRAGSRELRRVTTRILRDVGMIRVSAAVLGHDRPAADLFLAPTQPILLRDWRARALYGRDQVMIPAGRLVNGVYIRRETVAELRLFTLHFDSVVVIYAAGLELASAAPEDCTSA